MTIKPLQADFMNYTYFFKGNAAKGLEAFVNMIWNEKQFQIFINSESALVAAFTNDLKLKDFCLAVYSLGETKRNQVANAFAVALGYSNYEDLIADESAYIWRKQAVLYMTQGKSAVIPLTVENLKKSLEQQAVLDGWIGQSIDIGKILNVNEVKYDGECTIVGVNHEDRTDGTGKAMYTLATKDGTLLTSEGVDKLMSMGSSSAGGWSGSTLRGNLQKFTLEDTTLNSHLVAVNKISHNDHGNSNVSFVDATSDTFWVPSLYELFGMGVDSMSYPFYTMEGTPYAYLVNSDKVRYSVGGTKKAYWSRTTTGGTSGSYQSVSTTGSTSGVSVSSNQGVALFFCLG